MFVKVAVVVIAINGKMKSGRVFGEVRHRFSHPHYLQGLLAADAGTGFKITLKGAGTYFVLLC